MVRPAADRQLAVSADAAASSLSELTQFGLFDPNVARLLTTDELIRPSSRLLVSHSSSWSFGHNKRLGAIVLNTRRNSNYPIRIIVRHFRSRSQPGIGLGSERSSGTQFHVVDAAPAKNEKAVEPLVKKAEVPLQKELSLAADGLTPEEKERVRVSFIPLFMNKRIIHILCCRSLSLTAIWLHQKSRTKVVNGKFSRLSKTQLASCCLSSSFSRFWGCILLLTLPLCLIVNLPNRLFSR